MDVPIVADCKHALSAMNEWFDDEEHSDIEEEAARHLPWFEIIRGWTAAHPLSYKMDDKEIKPQYVIEKINELTKGEAIITTERNNFV